MELLRDRLRAWWPAALRGARVAVGRRAAAALAVVLVAGVGVAVVVAVRGRAEPASLSASPSPYDEGDASSARSTPLATAQAPPTSSATPQGIVVDVEGRVRAPGVHTLAVGARVDDALTAAGGVLPGVDVSTLDLAERLADGEQLRVGVPGAGVVAADAGGAGQGGVSGSGAADGSGADASTPGPGNPVDLNTADATELDALPGIGPALAARIVAWRQAHGDFASVASLAQVPGLGGRKLATLTPLVRV